MKTIIVNPLNPQEQALKLIKEALLEDKVIAFPTDTVYGLGVDIYDEKAVEKVFAIKGRPPAKGLIAMIGSLDQLEQVAKPSCTALTLIKRFWPGALTLVMEANTGLPELVKVKNSIGVRLPNHLLAQKLIQTAGFPLATTSANISGQPSALTATEVRAQLKGLVDLIVDGGAAYGQKESTIVDVMSDPPELIREGALSWQQIKEALLLA